MQYATGRTYDKLQVLEITEECRTVDAFGLDEVTATFRDESRHISGRVTVIVFNDGLGRAVLDAYDAGQYEQLTHQ